MMQLYNSLTRRLETFKPLVPPKVTFYHCGPTVYWTQHIGNLRGMTMGDLLRRSLEYQGYRVVHVRNYTDVGHLVSDADEGEDKMAKGVKREGLTPKQIADKYIAEFEKDTQALNLLEPTHKPRATEYVQEMQEMIATLLKKDFAYQTELAIYFSVAKFADYSQLSGQKLGEQEQGSGKGKVADPAKKQAQDFALWFFKKGEHCQALQTWDSPWGEGFPGWHLECSVMSKALLGKTIDIHLGGVEHIPVHHTNEIAQSEAANGVKFVNYWLHNEHLLVDEAKMAKSQGTGFSLVQILAKGYAAMDLRYLFLQAHYRSQQNFTWEALEAAKMARQNLLSALYPAFLSKTKGKLLTAYQARFQQALEADLNIPEALAITWELVNSQELPESVLATVLAFDQVLGLQIKKSLAVKIPDQVLKLAKKRQQARDGQDFVSADQSRAQIEKLGFIIEDKQASFVIKPKRFA